jgi:molecular chaperone GrpE
MDSAKQFAIQRFAADLLDSIDNLDRALTAVPKAAVGESETKPASTTSNTSSADPNIAAASESTGPPNKDLVALYGGLKMTSEIMLNTLKRHGLERYDPMERDGQKFDPNKDEATFFTKVEGKEEGSVFYTQSKGFTTVV